MYLLIIKGTYFKKSAVKWSNIRFVMQSSSRNKMWQCAKSAPRPACVPGHFTTRRAYPLPSTQYPVRIPRDQRPRRLSVHGSRSHRQSLPNQVVSASVPHSLSFLPVPTPTHSLCRFHPLSTRTIYLHRNIYRTEGFMFETYGHWKILLGILGASKCMIQLSYILL